ncbi:hypothetical protein BIV57_19170 [Mangrovactinospora gilvigrisea]|uniref:DUF317 domain-containing protein n=1 Tax=Mangrovactinospora gilvigrisea TaxID=1428644 RepID=A0A1J7BB17_9ACTN|nr:DUF317 domain-containing protein [Mangrovactinospora gilvigrisea]OIV35843.1 hypothetical protein BIV57_19170 [Mangrovactinospora gilvigrisea]
MPESGAPNEPAPKLLVNPRYLAGPTRTPDAALFPLLDAGWPFHTDHLDNLYFASPDERIRIAYLPQPTAWGREMTWSVTGWRNPFDRPRWSARFSADTPEEIVAGLTKALLDTYTDGGDRHLYGSRLRPTALEPLTAAGWDLTSDPAITLRHRATSPDGHAVLAADASAIPDDQDPDGFDLVRLQVAEAWAARFSYFFPPHLLHAVTRALADPAPVLRCESQIPEVFRTAVRCAPVRRPDPGTAATTASALATTAAEAPAEPISPATPDQAAPPHPADPSRSSSHPR